MSNSIPFSGELLRKTIHFSSSFLAIILIVYGRNHIIIPMIIFTFSLHLQGRDVQIKAYNQEYGTKYCTVIPGNIYGERDNFNLEYGHVIPSLIHKCYLAKKDNKSFNIWGDGSVYREFL